MRFIILSFCKFISACFVPIDPKDAWVLVFTQFMDSMASYQCLECLRNLI